MSSAVATEVPLERTQVVDVSYLEPEDLEPLWDREKRLWHQKLYWDVTPAISVIRRAVERKRLLGKASLLAGRAVGYGYYMVEGHRAVLGNLVLAPDGIDFPAIGSQVLGALIASLKAEPLVARIESQFVSFDMPWLSGLFVSDGFKEHQRAYLRRSLKHPPPVIPRPFVTVNPWSPTCLSEASDLMQRAHSRRVDAEMNELYRTREGCRVLLQNVYRSRGCGIPIPFASYVARDRDSNAMQGLVLSTEISSGHAHLAQVAVSPIVQGRGLGKLLVGLALRTLEEKGFRSVSLMVSTSNRRACSLYDSMGFKNVIGFPVFSLDFGTTGSQSRRE